MKIIISAFEPFGGSGRNSSLDTLRSLPYRMYGYDIIKVTLPVVYGDCGRILCEKIAEYEKSDVAAVMCLGQASGRGSITPEYAAINVRSSRAADNAGVKYELSPIEQGTDAADAYITTLPVGAIVEQMRKAGVPAAVSFTAGTYVCNDLMYAALSYCKPLKIPAGFIHLPLSLEIAVAETTLAGTLPTIPQSLLTRGIAEAVGTIKNFCSANPY